MKKLFVVLCALLSLSAFAAPVSLELQDVRLRDLARLVYGEVFRRSVVLDSSFLSSDDLVSVSLRSVDPQRVELEARRLFESHGFRVDDFGGVVRIFKLAPVDAMLSHEPFVYFPRHRSVSYLLDLVQGLFKDGVFASQRGGLGQSLNIAQIQGAVGAGAPIQAPASLAQAQSGINSQLGRDPDVLVFKGSRRDVDRLKSLLSQLDVAAGEVVVKAVVYEVRSADNSANAIKLAMSLLSSKVGITFSAGSADQASIKVQAGGLDAVFSALATDNRFKLVSAPVMRVKSGGNARFVAGADVPVLGNVSYSGVSGTPVQAVEYKSSGVILDVKPFVRADSNELQISQQISSFIPTTTGVNQSPTLIKRQLDTTVSVPEGELVMLGGLEERQDTDETSGFSFLPAFLRGASAAKQRTEIMIILDARRI